MDVPDFVTDPSWPQLSGNASLQFALLNAKTGKQLAFLVSPSDLSHNQAGFRWHPVIPRLPSVFIIPSTAPACRRMRRE
jgi:hypothetical protein